ncbi:alpha-(1,3)-fucosyltransferase C [Rhipicephalus microplus]|uniref:alpha-(1,3)-fucosyltransferase C n=1 Tax=Rhipicephalus microplus TaxID=6941 RepID=UPI003F6D2912
MSFKSSKRIMRHPDRATVLFIIVTASVIYYSSWLYYNKHRDESTELLPPTVKDALPQKVSQKHEAPVTTTTARVTTTTTTTTTIPAKDNAWTPFHNRTMNDGKTDLLRILFWTKIYGSWFSGLTEEGVAELEYKGCPDRCFIANHRSMLNVSDAVVFYGHDLDPGNKPEMRAPFQKWVYWSLEPPWHTPLASLKSLNNTINWTMTYRLDSDILDNYVKITKLVPAEQPYDKDPLENIWQRKFKMAAWAVSSCETSGKREHYVRELRKYIDVDVYGDCDENKCPRKMETSCYKMFARDYFFYLSFENCICRDYVTEKLFKPLTYDIIPVVYGGANYSDAAPPESYIDALSFESPRQLALHLKKVARDFNLYKRHFRWKGKFKIKPFTYYNFCALCRKLHSTDFKKSSVILDMHHWWNTTSYCRFWNKDTHKFEY